jgi:hypothetical protein
MNLKKEAQNLIKNGVYDPNELFRILYARHPVHYSRVREAVHEAKVS